MVFHIIVVLLNSLDVFFSLCFLAETQIGAELVLQVALLSEAERATIHEDDVAYFLFSALLEGEKRGSHSADLHRALFGNALVLLRHISVPEAEAVATLGVIVFYFVERLRPVALQLPLYDVLSLIRLEDVVLYEEVLASLLNLVITRELTGVL